MSALISGGEIINIHIGSAGSNIGSSIWQIIAKEHHLVTSLQIEKAKRQQRNEPGILDSTFDTPIQSGLVSQDGIAAFFCETLDRWVPRALFIDSDPAARYSGLFEPQSPLKHFFRPENFIFGRSSSAGIRPKAIAEGLKVTESTMNTVMREIELCDSLQAIQLTHHLGGGSGSGLGCLLLECLHDELNSSNVSILPTTLIPVALDIGRRTNPVEVYNSILSLPEIAELADLSFVIDNEALYDICFRLVGLTQPGWRDLNHIIGSVLSGFSSCMRFPSVHSTLPTVSKLHYRDFVSELKSNPNLPFVIPGFTPFTNRASNAPLGALLMSEINDKKSKDDTRPFELRYRKAGTRMPSVGELCRTLFRPSHLLASVDTLGHHYQSALAIFRGQVEPTEIEQEINYTRLNNKDGYKEWSQAMPTTFTTKICPEPDVGLNLSASWAGHTTATSVAIEGLIDQCEKLLIKKAFVHVYLREGLEEFELHDKLELCKDLVDLYAATYARSQTTRLEGYEAKRDLGVINPKNWNIDADPVVIFDQQKSIRVKF